MFKTLKLDLTHKIRFFQQRID